MRLFRKRTPPVLITTTYACGHTQDETALNFTGRGWCRACEAMQLVTSTQAWSE